MSQPDWLKNFENKASEMLEEAKVPGTAYALAQGGELVAQGGFGYRNREQGLPMTPDTILGIGSCTKSFTALAIMQLEEQGILSVNDPVVKWLPEFQVPDPRYRDAITIRHFLSHTSGLPPLPTLFNAMAKSLRSDPSVKDFPLALNVDELRYVETYDEVMELMAELDYELLGAPGEYLSYSNDGYGLLGEIIARASGVDYRTYMQEHLFDPMGLSHTTFDTAKLMTFPEVSEMYASKVDGEEVTVYAAPGRWELPPLEAAGQLASTARDMLRYLEVYRNKGVVGGTRIVSAAGIAEMVTPRAKVVTMPRTYYGYGLIIQPDYKGMTVIEHGGSIKGVDAQFMFVPEKELTLVVLANVSGSASSRVARTLMNAAAGLDLDQRRWELPEDEDSTVDPDRFVRRFVSDEGASLEFFIEDDELKATFNEQTSPVRVTTPDTVVIEAGEGMLARFLFDNDGEIWGVATGLRIIKKAG